MAQGNSLIQAALNGTRVPMTPQRLAEETTAVVALGCASVHLHVYDADGRESLAPEHVAAAVAAVRAAGPAVEIGISTGAWITPDVVAAIESWGDPLPDTASVNLSEEAHRAVMRALTERGIAIEAGLFTSPDVDRLSFSGFSETVRRALCEPGATELNDGRDQKQIAEGLERRLDGLGIGVPRMHHGNGPETWEVMLAAKRRGKAIRVGLEDVNTLPGGTRVDSNAPLYEAAMAL